MLKKLISILVNYTIYFFRRFFLRQSKEVAMREYYEGYVKSEIEKNKQKKMANIIVANTNLNKYTETFIQKHIEELPFYIHFLYGEPAIIHAKKGNLVFKSQKQKQYYFLKDSFFKSSISSFIISKLKRFIKKNKIKLILAEFGPTGAFFTPIAKASQTPLICIFHGYDAWNKKTLALTNYLELFEQASAIIGVSKDICFQLEKLGCPKGKINYLPCSINTQLYQYSNHKNNAPIFLSVGRFAETKSPHLTILAFKEVLNKLPNAQLRMIGKDGGGELFEACHILVKALQIEDKVHFLGIKTPEEVANEMKNARVFIQHSITTPLNNDKEGTPVSVMEAMACGLAIVTTQHAGIAEIIEHGKTGFLVKEFDYLAMAKAMYKVCNDDDLVEQLGIAASKSILENPLLKNNSLILADIIEKSMNQ